MPRSKYVKATQHGKAGVLYETEDGETFLYTGGTWTWRNNNPGNLVPGDVSKRNNQIGKAGGFAVFPDYETGHKALLDCLRTTHGNKSIDALMKAYAPEFQNDTKKYIKFIRNKTGVTDDKNVKDFSPEEFEKLWKAIEQMEGWKEGKSAEFKDNNKKTAKKSKSNSCGPGQHWVSAHDRLLASGKVAKVSGHCRENPHRKV